MGIKEYKIGVEDRVLEELKARLKHTKWATWIRESGWQIGTDYEYLSALVDHWIERYEWRERAERMNRIPQFRCRIDGVELHFFYIKGKSKKSQPLILTHGWPDSFVRYLKVIPLLTEPGKEDGNSFDLIIPSLPGVGFSAMEEPRGFNNSQVADLWAKLMTEELGYAQFGAAGGDIGSGVTRYLALHYPEQVVGIHLTDVGIIRSIVTSDDHLLTEEERRYKATAQQWMMQEGGYMSIQSTKPQTLAWALSDSPVGLAAWIVEKFRTWSDCREGFGAKYTMDELLDNVMVYWLNNSIAASVRMYYENTHSLPPMGKIGVPTGIALFAKDILPPPKEWVAQNLNLVHWTEIPRGGHFTAMEEPELFADDLRGFFGSLPANDMK